MEGLAIITVVATGVALAVFSASSGRAAGCYKGGDTVTIVGTIHMKTLPPNPDLKRTKSWTYPVLTFDHPVCVKDPGFGDVPDGKVASVTFDPKVQRTLSEGQHVSLRGQLAPPDNGSQPPEPLMLRDGEIGPAPALLFKPAS